LSWREKEEGDDRPDRGTGPSALFWIGLGAAGLIVIAFILLPALREGGEPGSVRPAARVEAPAVANANTPRQPTSDIRARPPAEQLAAAFRAAFGRDRRTTRIAGDAVITYEPGGLRWIGNRAVLISPGESDQQCHSCPGMLAVHYLEPEGSGFRVAGAWLDGGGSGSWGRPPEASFSTLLSTQPMLESRGGWGGQGIVCTNVTYYEFTPRGPRSVADIQLTYSDADSPFSDGRARTVYDGTITHIVKDRSFDVVYGGTLRLTDHYRRVGERYVRTPGANRLSRRDC
jgi:hypothetical protein